MGLHIFKFFELEGFTRDFGMFSDLGLPDYVKKL